jgi:Recombinase
MRKRANCSAFAGLRIIINDASPKDRPRRDLTRVAPWFGQEILFDAERIVNSWIGKRANMLTIDEETKKVVQVTPLTSLLPKWLKIEGRIVRNGKVINAGKIVEVPGIVAIVHEIFRLAALGLGAKKIRQSLNGQGDAVTMAWITYTLQNEQVLGKFQHHHYENGKRVPYGEPVFDYYPRIISDEEWRFARAEIDRKNSVDTATRKMTHGARNSDRAENLFSGLIFDATTEPVRTLIFQRQRNKKGSLQNPFLVTSTAIEGPSHRLRYDILRLFIT